MNDCDQVREWLLPFLEDSALHREKEAVSRHVRDCAACAAEMKDLEASARFVREQGPIAPPPGWSRQFATRVVSLLPPDSASSEPRRFPFATAAALFLGALGGWAASRLSPSEDGRTTALLQSLTREVEALRDQIRLQAQPEPEGAPRLTVAQIRGRLREQLRGPFSLGSEIVEDALTDEEVIRRTLRTLRARGIPIPPVD